MENACGVTRNEKRGRSLGGLLRLLFLFSFLWSGLAAQTVQPLIAEYNGKGEGSFTVTNGSFQDTAVILEAQSFSIDPEGRGLYRPLDPAIHLQLSSSSLRLGPRETQTVFYKANAEALPAWFTIYATFAPLHPGPGVNLHIMLPHTVYLYSERPLQRDDITITNLTYQPATQQVTLEVADNGPSAARVQGVEVVAGHARSEIAGFPLLPGSPRKLVVPWKEATAPASLTLTLDRFRMKLPVASPPLP